MNYSKIELNSFYSFVTGLSNTACGGMGKSREMNEKKRKARPGRGGGALREQGKKGRAGRAGEGGGKPGRGGGVLAGGAGAALEREPAGRRVKISGPDCPGGQKMV